MPQVLVMTDSVACIPKELLAHYHIPVLPAGEIRFNGDVCCVFSPIMGYHPSLDTI